MSIYLLLLTLVYVCIPAFAHFPPAMTCNTETFYDAPYQATISNTKYPYYKFMSGLYTEYDDNYQDRIYRWSYCKPSNFQGNIRMYYTLPDTPYYPHTLWYRNCTQNFGNSALVAVKSDWNDDSNPDRSWRFYCGYLPHGYKLNHCSRHYNWNFPDVWNFNCPNNGVIRGIASTYKSQQYAIHERVFFRIECCTFDYDTHSAIVNEEAADDNDHEIDVNTTTDRYQTIIIMAIASGLCILCGILSVCVCKRKRVVGKHKYVIKSQDEDEDENDAIEMEEIGTNLDDHEKETKIGE